jgi:hypothetical protein
MLAVATLVILAAGLGLPYALPLGDYIPGIERAGREALHQPVRIAALRLYFLPRPHLTLYDVSMGEPLVAAVHSVVVTPRLSTLFSDARVIDDVVLERPWVAPPALVVLGDRSKLADPRPGASSVRLKQLHVHSGELRFAGGSIGAIEAAVTFDESGAPRRIEVSQKDGLFVTLDGQGRDFAVTASARDWRLPAGPPLHFERLNAHGTLGAQGLALRHLEARVHGGSVTGAARLGWKGPWKLEGALTVKDVEIAPVASLFTSVSALSGKIRARPSFSSTAPNFGALGDALRLETDFEITHGVLKKLDLAAAARSIFGMGDRHGGDTRFDQLSGHLGIDPDGYHFSELSIVSGMLKAEGDLSISRSRTLSGEITAEVRGTASLIATPLAISGTIEDPVVYPTKASLAGAALGTVIMPGIGTAIGARAGQLTKRLFGGGSRKARQQGAVRP